MCVSVRSKVTQARLAAENSNMCTQAEVARGLSFTHTCMHLHTDTRRHIPAPSAQERALESTRDPGVNSTAISTHLSYRHYIRIYWPLHWVVSRSCSVQGIDSLKLAVISGVFLSFCFLLQANLSFSPWWFFFSKGLTMQGGCVMHMILCN